MRVFEEPGLQRLAEASLTERAHLMWAAACRRYELIGDFAEEILRERYLLLTPTLDRGAIDITSPDAIGQLRALSEAHGNVCLRRAGFPGRLTLTAIDVRETVTDD